MSTPPILIIKRGSCTKKDIELVRKAGVAVLEVEDPKDVRYMDPPLEPTTRIEVLCRKIVENTLRKDVTLYPSQIKERIWQMVMNDAQPPKADGVPS